MKIFRKHEIPNPVFHYDVVVVVTDDFKAAVKKLKLSPQNANDLFEDQTSAIHIFTHNEATSFILLHPKANIGTVVHEVWHAVRRLLEYINAGLDNEIVAYLLGYYTRHVVDILKGSKK